MRGFPALECGGVSGTLPHKKSGGKLLAVGSAIEKRGFVYVYDEKGRSLFTKQTGTQPNDGLKGYTATTVSIRRGSFLYTYDEKGRQLSSKSAR